MTATEPGGNVQTLYDRNKESFPRGSVVKNLETRGQMLAWEDFILHGATKLSATAEPEL